MVLDVWLWSATHGDALWVARLFALALIVVVGWGLGSRTRFGVTRAAGIGVLSCILAELVVGEIAWSRLRSSLARQPNADPAEVAESAIAVFTHRRDAALLALSNALDARDAPDPVRIAARALLHTARGDVVGAATIWMEHGLPELGAQTAASAAQWRLAARGYYLAGDFQRSSDCFELDRDHASLGELRLSLLSHLLSGSLSRAESAARALAKPHGASARGATATCLADAIADRRRPVAERSRHIDPRRVPLSVACAALEADLLDGEARIERLSEQRLDGDDAPRAWLELLHAEASPATFDAPPPPWSSAAAAFALPTAWVGRSLPAVERTLAESLANRGRDRMRASRVNTYLGVALFAELIGDHATAARFEALARAEAEGLVLETGKDPPPEVAAIQSRQASLTSVLAIARLDAGAGETAGFGADAASHWLLAVRLGVSPDNDAGAHAFAGMSEGWELVRSRRFGELAQALQRGAVEPGTFLRFADPNVDETPRLVRRAGPPATGIEELRTWVGWGRSPQGVPGPTQFLIELHSRASAARALGEANVAKAIETRARSFERALLRRTTSVLLAVAESLGSDAEQ